MKTQAFRDSFVLNHIETGAAYAYSYSYRAWQIRSYFNTPYYYYPIVCWAMIPISVKSTNFCLSICALVPTGSFISFSQRGAFR